MEIYINNYLFIYFKVHSLQNSSAVQGSIAMQLKPTVCGVQSRFIASRRVSRQCGRRLAGLGVSGLGRSAGDACELRFNPGGGGF